ncbi:MAG: molybdopterin-binding protein [Pelolinea sp.]|nr:molybdopterin-binding protein [Pelolinea sp.]
MPSAEIIAIGTELLLGEISDTNTAYIAKSLNQIGIDVFRTLIVGDNTTRITDQIKQSLDQADIVITTGGLGPTVDDPTRQAVADVFNEELIFQDQLWDQILSRFQKFNNTPTSNNKRQAYIPQNAVPIENEMGTAPAFYISEKGKTIVSLPGVPAEMEFLVNEKVISLLIELHDLKGTIYSRIIHTAGIGESSLDNLIGDLEKLNNPTVGVTAKPGQVDIRITAKAKTKVHAKKIILPIEKDILQKVGNYVYGFDQDTLQSVVTQMIINKKIGISLFHKDTNVELMGRLIKLGIFQSLKPVEDLDQNTEEIEQSLYNKSYSQIMRVFFEECSTPKQGFTMKIMFKENTYEKDFWFGGHFILFYSWIENILLNFIREVILQKGEK